MTEIELSDGFRLALWQAMDDHERWGAISRDGFSENGAMRAVGITRSDAVAMALMLHETYGRSLATGWDCPTCGRQRDEDGDCPEGHEFDPSTLEAGRIETLIAVVEFALATGVHLERKRWEE